MMRSDTRTVSLNAPAEQVFAFLADPRNLPKWAIAFAHSIHAEGDAWLVQTSTGEIRLSLTTNAEQGTIDFHMSPLQGASITAHSRVLPVGEGAEYVFTQIQPPGMPDTMFDAQVTALREELKVLQSIMNARAACPN